ncbi:putative steroid dehydrogenase [Hypoxylon rubiginosum]|uniref:Steroid dehydrogenase n=1 Tax=Hypoxylon rubiginosum TaxID=110542 RepID=A0ACC0CQI7_9PEZI|nr:putative steroid dehydrogenase [Hypoxylon rubiginosum]
MSFGTIWTQFFPPRNGAPLTEANLPSQAGKVFIVTGGSSGLGYELSRILYGAGGKVYILSRSKEHTDDAISRIKAHYDECNGGNAEAQGVTGRREVISKRGQLEFIQMDVTDFSSIQSAVQEFLGREGPDGRLDVLFNNVGTGARKNAPPTPQGDEYHFGTNSIGPYFLTQKLIPFLSKTAAKSPKDSVRVVWSASVLIEVLSPQTGIRKEFLQDTRSVTDINELYATSKTANWFLASEFARRTSGTGVVHIAGNPGNYATNIYRHLPGLLYYVLWPILRDPVHGAETYMWMAFSESVTMDEAVSGRYAMCDGRWHPGQREDVVLALRSVEEGGSGRAREYFDWCEAKVTQFES